MKRLLLLALIGSGLWADTLVSGSMTFHTGVVPFNSDTSFDLQLSGGPITTFDVFHEYQQGAKGGGPENFTQGGFFSFAPVPTNELQVVGVSTPYTVVVNGVKYVESAFGAVPYDPTNDFSASYTLTQLSGTNVVDTTQDSTATGLFLISGTVSASVNGATYTDPFSAYAAFSGYYSTVVSPSQPYPVLSETYTFSATPEPETVLTVLGGLGLVGACGLKRRR